jgi:hypothetical protein
MEITITKDELFSIIKEAVKVTLHEEKIGLYLESVPTVSQEEMDEIERIHGKHDITQTIEVCHANYTKS